MWILVNQHMTSILVSMSIIGIVSVFIIEQASIYESNSQFILSLALLELTEVVANNVIFRLSKLTIAIKSIVASLIFLFIGNYIFCVAIFDKLIIFPTNSLVFPTVLVPLFIITTILTWKKQEWAIASQTSIVGLTYVVLLLISLSFKATIHSPVNIEICPYILIALISIFLSYLNLKKFVFEQISLAKA